MVLAILHHLSTQVEMTQNQQQQQLQDLVRPVLEDISKYKDSIKNRNRPRGVELLFFFSGTSRVKDRCLKSHHSRGLKASAGFAASRPNPTGLDSRRKSTFSPGSIQPLRTRVPAFYVFCFGCFLWCCAAFVFKKMVILFFTAIVVNWIICLTFLKHQLNAFQPKKGMFLASVGVSRWCVLDLEVNME